DAAVVDQPVDVAKPDVLAPDPQFQQHVQAGDARRAAAGGHHLDLVKAAAGHAQRVGRGRTHHDGSAVLVVVEHRDVHRFAAQPFDHETIGRLDVLEVDGAKGGFQRAHDLGQLDRVGFVDLDVETIDVGKFLEQDRLALHHRLRGEGADIAKPQHGGAVRDHGDQIPA